MRIERLRGRMRTPSARVKAEVGRSGSARSQPPALTASPGEGFFPAGRHAYDPPPIAARPLHARDHRPAARGVTGPCAGAARGRIFAAAGATCRTGPPGRTPPPAGTVLEDEE